MNKYAICFSLYDNYKVSETNLYYYKGILYCLGFCNRDFDIYIDTTEYCKEKLLEVVNQENLSLDNVYFIIHEESDFLYKLWSIVTFCKNYYKYDIIGFYNSKHELGENFFSKIKDLNYSIYSVIPQTTSNSLIFNYNCSLLNYDCYFINCKKISGNINYLKIIYEYVDMLYKINDLFIIKESIINYNYNLFLNNLFSKIIYNNDVLYLNNKNLKIDYLSKYQNVFNYDDIKWYWYKYDIYKSKYFNNGEYKIQNKIKKYNIDVELSFKYDIDDMEYISTYLKYINLQIRRFMFGYIDNLDLTKNNIIIDIIKKSLNSKKCVVYCVDDNKKFNELLDISLNSLRKYNDLDCIIITIRNNKYVNDIAKKYNNIRILYVDKFYDQYIKNIDKKVRQEISNFAYIKICIPLFDEIRNNYDYVLVSDCDIEYYHKIEQEFLELSDNIDICGHTNYDDTKCGQKIECILGDKYSYTNEYINCGYFIYNIKNKIFDPETYLPLVLKYIKISNDNSLYNFEQDALYIFNELKIKRFKKQYFMYCYTKEQFLNHVDNKHLHYICNGKDIMINNIKKDSNFNIINQSKNNVFIYSNFNPYKCKETYKQKIKEFLSYCKKDDIHIFLNRCVPYFKELYNNTTNYFVGRCVCDPLKFNGQSYLGQYISLDNSNSFNNRYIISEHSHDFYELQNFEIKNINTDTYKKKIKEISIKYTDNRPITTGLVTYIYFKEKFNDVFPVNFYGTKSIDKFNFEHGDDFHKLSGEERYYIDNNIEMLYI